MRSVTISRLRANGAGQLDCTVTTDGVPETDVGPTHCGDRWPGPARTNCCETAPAPVEVTMVSAVGPADSGVEAGGGGRGRLWRPPVRSGSPTWSSARTAASPQCRIRRAHDPFRPRRSRTCPSFASCRRRERRRMFEPTTDPAPRRARQSVRALYQGLAGGLARARGHARARRRAPRNPACRNGRAA